MKRIVAVGLSCMALWMSWVSAVAAEPKMGVVVMHGKWGNPKGSVASFASAMEHAGFVVESPEMPWSGRRLYDAGMEGVVAEIGAAVKSLRDKGATKVCLAGHSLGAAGAIYYASRVQVDCIIALAPGHNPESNFMRSYTLSDMGIAKAMVAEGKGDEKAAFGDYNTGNRTKKISMPAKVFMEYFDGDGPMNMANNASKILPGTQVLWVVGKDESEGAKRNGGAAYQNIPAGVSKQFVEVPGGHGETPDKAIDLAPTWIRDNIKM